MKKLVLIAVLSLLSAAAMASDRDFLLTSDGTLFTATVEEGAGVNNAFDTSLVVTERRDDGSITRHVLPESVRGGHNADPALAYDPESRTLFLFWLHSPYALSSELRFTSLDANGKWSPAVTFESAAYNLRQNLRIALTSKARHIEEDGAEVVEPELNIHALWWEESGTGERARYAMLTIEKGQVRRPIVARDLTSFLKEETKPFAVEDHFNDDVLRFPTAVATPGRESVDVLFGDTTTKSFHRLNLTPVGDARVRIPVGRREREIAPPASFRMKADGAITAISPSDDRMALYFENEGAVKYLVWRDEKWSTVRSIDVDEAVTSQTAVEAIRRMVSSY